ncbi:glucan biosynthesis protein [Marinivivus vitaminiproducens]|uniref:glucan biosynthesis protein n=1 Tax=Marinivivus vitaminiproducens TaxID=3035935 RepID=UPI0027A729E3|nr:glucan biosynthesis protein D [Geminicoccaceae bacterium SCSIO 64248]
MTSTVTRRRLLGSAASAAVSLCALGAGRKPFAATSGLNFGEPQPFTFDALIERAQDLASRPYQPPYQPAPDIVRQIDYAVHGQIRFKPENALFAEGPGVYPVTFFHLGAFFPKAVRMHVLEGGQAREIVYSADYFDMPGDSVARGLPADSGFAGFRLQESRRRDDWRTQDWVAYLGASYVRAIGQLGQYGMSARGIALDVAASEPEEFPDFIAFYIEPAPSESEPVTVHALMDGPSIAGAYRFAIRRTEGVVMDVETHLFMRAPVERFGVAPLVSMFWFAEYNRGFEIDWRPEVHDSDGLALWTGAGERLWRPLNNPQRVITSSFTDDNPRGFGLLQRDRRFENYLDGVNYDRRPSVWVEPLDGWGRGAVQLVEIPTDDEIHDNIGAFWVPEAPVQAGDRFTFGYRLHWLAEEPFPATEIARIAATRIGRGGEPGKPRPDGVHKFVVEFEGQALEGLDQGSKPQPVISASRGEVSYVFAEPVPNTSRWRAQFDVTVAGSDPVELRLFLAEGDRALSETWLYQYDPSRSPG